MLKIKKSRAHLRGLEPSMYLSRRTVLAVVFMFSLVLGCNESGGVERDGSLQDTTTGDIEDGGTGDTSPPPQDSSSDSTTDASEVADAGDTGATRDADDADAPIEPTEPRVAVHFDSDWIHTEVEGGLVEVDCRYLNADGHPQADPGDFEVTTAAPEAIENEDGTYAFADAGVYPFTCSSASLDMSATRDLVVAFEGIDYRYVETSQVLSAYSPVLEDIVATNAGLDVDGYEDAVDRLEELGQEFPDLNDVDFLIDNPHGWPSVQDLRDAGLSDGTDDPQWASALGELSQAIADERAVLSGLNEAPSAQDLAGLEAAVSTTSSAHAHLATFEPSEIAVWSHRDELAGLFDELAATAKVRSAKLAPIFRAAPPTASFSIVGTLASIAINEVVGSYTYKAILTDVGKALVANMISIAIKDLINRGFVATANSPELDSVHGSAASFVGAGLPFTAAGSFNSDYEKMRIIFIPPTLSNNLAGIVDIIGSIDGITQQANVLKLINTLRKLIDQLVNTFQAAATASDVFIVLTPESGDERFLEFPPLPEGLNCSRFQVPVAGTMLPVDFDWGRGAAINMNVLGEAAGNCSN
jgi:hypothetical protein